MPSESGATDEQKRQIGGELIIPAIALIFTLYYIITILDSPWTAQVNAYMVGSVLILLVLIFLAVALRELVQGRATLGASNLFAPRAILAKRIGFIALTVMYLIALEWAGFTLTTFLFLALSMLLLGNGRRPGLYIGSSAAMAIIAYGVFIALFETRFPKGPIEHLLAGLF